MMSKSAMERNRAPENVMAMLIMEPYLKHRMPEMNFPKTRTYPKKMNIRIILIMRVVYIAFKLLLRIHSCI